MVAPSTWKHEGFAYAVLSALPALIVVIDGQGTIVAANSEWGEAACAAGSPDLVETTIGRNYLNICSQGAAAGATGAQETLEGLEAVLHGKSSIFTFEYPCPVDDEIKWYLLYATPLAPPECGAVVAHINITDRKELEQQLRRSTQEMSDFLKLVGHELRSPLTSIRGHLQLIERRLQRLLSAEAFPDPALVETLTRQVAPMLDSLERAEAQAGRLNRLIEDIVEVARIQSHQLKLVPVKANLAELVREMIAELRLAWPTRAILLDVPDEAVIVEIDVGRIEQVVINYVTNALKYSPADRPITVSLLVENPQARVSVQDEGPGLPPQELARIWERFYRVRGIEAQEGSSGGLGLGLSICRSIVQEHGGQVGVESTPGTGSTFWFSLPLRSAVSAPCSSIILV